MVVPIFVILREKRLIDLKYKLHRMGGTNMTKEQSIKEVEYKMSLKLLNILLSREIITDEEYGKIDDLNRQTFSPELSEVYD